MKLITSTLAKKLPALYATSELSSKDVTVHVKLFDSRGKYTWFITEYDPETGQAFGLVKGDFVELGYISINELEEINEEYNNRIEREIYWKPMTLAEVKKNIKTA